MINAFLAVPVGVEPSIVAAVAATGAYDAAWQSLLVSGAALIFTLMVLACMGWLFKRFAILANAMNVKASELAAQVQEVHILTNANLSSVTNQRDMEIQRNQLLVQQMDDLISERDKKEKLDASAVAAALKPTPHPSVIAVDKMEVKELNVPEKS